MSPEPTDAPPWSRGWRLAALLAAYPAAWMLLEALSSPMAFWPVVLRFLLVWWLPVRLWPWVAGADIAAALLARQVFQGEPFALGPLLVSVAPVLLYMAVVAAVRGATPIDRPERTRSMAQLVVACTLSAFVVAPVLASWVTVADGVRDAWLGAFLGFGFGDLFGMMIGVPMLVALRANGFALWRSRRWLFEGALALAVCGGLLTVAREHPALHEHLLLVAMLPAVVLAFRHGWIGASWAVAVLGLLLVFGVAGLDDRLRLHVTGSVIGGSALLLGAAMSHVRAQRETVEAQHASLRIALLEQRELAARIVALEDEGQRHVAESLHQQVAPPLEELRTQLSMAWRAGGRDGDGRQLESLRDHLWRVQDGLERALRRVQPPALTESDLAALLANGPLWDWALEQGATWSATLEGPVQELPERVRVLLYRMAQTGLKQCLANGDRHFELHVAARRRPGRFDVDWALATGGGGGGGAAGKPMHASAIQDRALAAGGDYRLEPRTGGWVHRVRIADIPASPA